MKHIRMIAAFVLALLLFCVPGFAQKAAAEGDYAFPDVYEEAPEDIILPAMEMYSWFTISPLDVDPDMPGSDGSVFRVADEMLCSYDTMMRLLDFTFSPELVEEMFAYGKYTVIDGYLYGTAGGRGVDPLISEVIYEETHRSEDKIVYTVTVNYLGGSEPHVLEFVREQVNGLWVFTHFPFFW